METREELIDETLISIKEYISKFIAGLETVIVHLQKDHIDESLQSLPAIVDGLEWLLKAAHLTSEKQKERLNIESLNIVFEEINEALENQDYIHLRDILEFEILVKLKKWQLSNFID